MNVKSNRIKRRRTTQTDKEPTASDKNPKRTNAKTFYLLDKRVCQAFFLKTLSISNGPLLKAFEHKNKFTNFFDGDDQRGKHQPSNRLTADTIASIVEHLESFASKNPSNKCKKRIICDAEVRSLKQLYRLYQDSREESEHCPSYSSFKKIFVENGFAMADHLMSRPQRSITEHQQEDQEIEYIIKEDSTKAISVNETTTLMPVIQQVVQQPKLLITQVQESQDAAKLVYPVYEIQLVNFHLAANPNQSFQ